MIHQWNCWDVQKSDDPPDTQTRHRISPSTPPCATTFHDSLFKNIKPPHRSRSPPHSVSFPSTTGSRSSTSKRVSTILISVQLHQTVMKNTNMCKIRSQRCFFGAFGSNENRAVKEAASIWPPRLNFRSMMRCLIKAIMIWGGFVLGRDESKFTPTEKGRKHAWLHRPRPRSFDASLAWLWPALSVLSASLDFRRPFDDHRAKSMQLRSLIIRAATSFPFYFGTCMTQSCVGRMQMTRNGFWRFSLCCLSFHYQSAWALYWFSRSLRFYSNSTLHSSHHRNSGERNVTSTTAFRIDWCSLWESRACLINTYSNFEMRKKKFS